ncbi:MAG: PolC-type DNA polymerase III [Clostridia bacterium]|nr:PolC-type DNA polymerase III [Clostridia bacterium]
MALSEKTQRTLLDIFHKYRPNEGTAAVLLSAYDYKLRIDREQKLVEVRAHFPALISKRDLYRIEEEIRLAHEINGVRILPTYPRALLTEEYVPQLITELMRIGAVSRGFFDRYRLISMTEDTLVLEIPFTEGGVELVDRAHTPRLLEEIIAREFGCAVRVQVRRSENGAEDYAAFERSNAEYIASLAREAEARAREAQQDRREADAAEEALSLQKTVNTLDTHPLRFSHTEEHIWQIGNMTFDTSSPEVVLGEMFEPTDVTPIRNLVDAKRNVMTMGMLTGVDSKETRNGDKMIITLFLSDMDSSLTMKLVLPTDEAKPLLKTLTAKKKKVKRGTADVISYYIALMVRGNLRADRFDGEQVLTPNDILQIHYLEREDNAPVKRVELHCHTNMSSMDATIPPDVLVKTAVRFGMPAVAVTDHGNVQSFPEMMLAAEKTDLKVIYGMEAYFVDDTARALYGATDGDFGEECIVFDIETTGLSNLNDKITEIGAVRIRDGQVIDRFNTFVDPERPIPADITALTGITDEMVSGAPKIKEALEAFFSFIGGEDKLLIAHNAGFDVGFIRRAAEQCDMPFPNPYLDTVAMSRYVNPDLKKHKLNIIAEYFGLGDFNHHRASDDAEMLAQIYFCMTDKLHREGVQTFDQMRQAMSEKADPLKLKTYHQIILVKNLVGLKNLYKLISSSYLKYYKKTPRIPKTLLEEHREGLILGSACESGELFRAILENRPEAEIKEIAKFYDYLEIQPLCNNGFLIADRTVADEEGLKALNRRIVALGEELSIPVVATCDAHFMEKHDEIVRKILMAGMKFSDADRDIGLYFRTTEEMLAEFAYLGEEKAYEVVVTNPNRIADQIEKIRPIPEGQYTPKMDGAEEELQRLCWEKAREWYSDDLPEVVSERLERELTSIIKHGFAVLYMIAQKLVAYSNSLGYMVGSRGSVGSSFVASMSGISEVNPLPPHYRCPSCRYSEFIMDGSYGSGYDLPPKECPHCKAQLIRDGHDIPFETFLGFYGDKSPDIDLNFSGDVQGKVHKYTAELFGAENVFRAGTIGSLASKTAFGYIAKYAEERSIKLNRAEIDRLINCMVGIKRTTGQHPGGIIVVPREYDIYDFTPVQHPADAVDSDIITTHFQFTYLHETILKLDELGHDMPTKLKILERYTGIAASEVDTSDRAVYDLFLSCAPLGLKPDDIMGCELGTWGLPEFGTPFAQGMLKEAKPKNFSDLLQISGLSHGTDVWLGNAQDLIRDGTCTISEVIGTRDSIMLYLSYSGVEKSMAFKTMESVRKGKGLTPEMEAAMREKNVPDWYIASCKKIKYMFPKAHAAAYVMQAIQFAWYKVHRPLEFYAAYFTAAPDGFEADIVMRGRSGVIAKINEIRGKGNEATQKDADVEDALKIVMESMARGVRYLPPDLYRSDVRAFLPEDGKIRMPFISLPGLGLTAAEKIVHVRDEGQIYSKLELQERAKLSKAVMEILQVNGVLDGMSETDQLSLF